MVLFLRGQMKFGQISQTTPILLAIFAVSPRICFNKFGHTLSRNWKTRFSLCHDGKFFSFLG